MPYVLSALRYRERFKMSPLEYHFTPQYMIDRDLDIYFIESDVINSNSKKK